MPSPSRFRSGIFKKYDDVPSEEGATGKKSKSVPCVVESTSFKDCLKKSGKDRKQCQFLKEKLTECHKALIQPLPLIPLPKLEEDEDDMYVLTGDPCFAHSQAFEVCLKTSGNDSSRCEFLKDKLTECRKGTASTYGYASQFRGMDDDEKWF